MPSFRCPSCGKTYKWNESIAGKVVQCTSCQQNMTVPEVQAASPSVDLASESYLIVAKGKGGDYNEFKYAPPPEPTPQKKNVYIILDGSDAAIVGVILLGAVLLVGIGWMVAREFTRADLPPVPAAAAPEAPAPEASQFTDAKMAPEGEEISLLNGNCRVVSESEVAGQRFALGMAIELGIDYQINQGETLGGDGLTHLVILGDGIEGRTPLEHMNAPSGRLRLAFRWEKAHREAIRSITAHVEGPGGKKISNVLELPIPPAQTSEPDPSG